MYVLLAGCICIMCYERSVFPGVTRLSCPVLFSAMVGDSLMHIAASYGHLEILRWFKDIGFPFNVVRTTLSTLSCVFCVFKK